MTHRLIAWLVSVQARKPVASLVFVGVVTAFFAVHAACLELRTRYDALLPENAPSVIELHRLEQRTAASQTLLILLEGSDRDALHRMGDDLVTELRALGPDTVSTAEDGTRLARDFIAPRSALFLPQAELARIEQQVEEHWDNAVQKEVGFALDDDSAPPPPPLPTAESFRNKTTLIDRFPSGYFENASGTALVVAAHSPVAGGDLPRIEGSLSAMYAAVERVVQAAPERTFIRVSYAGDMPTAFAEYRVVLTDLVDVGAAGIALILAVVALYFLRFRAIFVMGVTILVGLVWTFGFTHLVIGHLNVATAPLVSIVAGNGINVGILYQSRYFEERARGVPAHEAIRSAVFSTWQPTVIAALAAAASYASLLTTDFRAFRDFGFIAASGMIACWIVKTLMVPPLLVLLERVMPDERAGRPLRAFDMAYGKPFAWFATRAPRLIVTVGVGVVVIGTIAAFRYAAHDPLDYDTRTTQTTDAHGAALERAWRVCNGILGASQGAMIVATDSAADASAAAAALRARWDQAPADRKPFAAVHVLSDFVPKDQADKIPMLREIGDRLRRGHERGFVREEDWRKLVEVMPPADLEPFDIADLPESIAAPFTDKRGVRGALVLVEASPDTSNDFRSLVAFANAYRTITLPDGKVVRGSGRAVIFADILEAVAHDVPKAILLSLVLSIGVVVVTFRRRIADLCTILFALWAGIAGVAMYLYFAHIKINFVNFAALPVTLGIGVDYSINVAQRYVADGRRDVVAALRTSGGAVVLCSLTTLLGYLALLGSHNAAIRSLGTIAALGESCCLLAAVVVLPAIYIVRDHRRAVREPDGSYNSRDVAADERASARPGVHAGVHRPR